MSERRSLDTFPMAMTADDIGAWLGISRNAVYKLHETGRLVFAEIKPRLGKLRWNRERLRAWEEQRLAGVTGTRRLTAVG